MTHARRPFCSSTTGGRPAARRASARRTAMTCKSAKALLTAVAIIRRWRRRGIVTISAIGLFSVRVGTGHVNSMAVKIELLGHCWISSIVSFVSRIVLLLWTCPLLSRAEDLIILFHSPSATDCRSSSCASTSSPRSCKLCESEVLFGIRVNGRGVSDALTHPCGSRTYAREAGTDAQFSQNQSPSGMAASGGSLPTRENQTREEMTCLCHDFCRSSGHAQIVASIKIGAYRQKMW